MREGYEGGDRGRTDSQACVIIELAIFRSLSGDDASVSVEKSNHASSQAVSKSLHSNYHCVALLMKLLLLPA